MIKLRGVRLSAGEGADELKKRTARILRLRPEDILEISLLKKSLDARHKDDIHFICTVAVSAKADEAKLLARAGRDAESYRLEEYRIPKAPSGVPRPLVVGFGPAGMFSALVLAKAGARPIVIERGQDVQTRLAAVEAFRRGGRLDENCNVQFGEGGAGTFSDGKLNTGVKDRRMGWMLAQFAAHGAPESILYDAKPHIGTDILVDVVRRIRQEIISLGGEVRFGVKLERILINDGRVCGAELCSGELQLCEPCSSLILALGHSARDTFEALLAQGVPMEPKPFSMGVRIEHRQSDIDAAQYGRARAALPPADYALSIHLPNGESAYTFCMCPGGEVFAAASEQGGVVTNGMSYSGRDGENANSALLVTLHPQDFPGNGILDGMYWQRSIERAAYDYGGGNYFAPAQLVGDFLSGKKSVGPADVIPSYKPGVIWGDIREVLPQRITAVLEAALPELGKKLRGFDAPTAVLTAPETRSSSPVRILRDASMQSSVKGLYPCGEGAGYAGGISSAAMDGMRCAEAVLSTLCQ